MTETSSDIAFASAVPDRGETVTGQGAEIPDLARIARLIPMGFECRSCGAAVYNHYIRIHHLLTTGEPCCPDMREWVRRAGEERSLDEDAKDAPAITSAQAGTESELLVYTDGACKGNPGPAAIAWALVGRLTGNPVGRPERPGQDAVIHEAPGHEAREHDARGHDATGHEGSEKSPTQGVLAEGSRSIGISTNQVAEIVAATEGLDHLPPGSRVRLRTDSLYVVNTMMEGWRRKANKQYWSSLDRAVSRHREVIFEHVRGHHGEEWNEYVDKRASAACRA